MKNKTPKIAYRFWQDRATAFYLAARILHKGKYIPEASAFCSYQAIENIIKGALEFKGIPLPTKDGHNFSILTKLFEPHIKISIPSYFDDFQEVTRYPESRKNRGPGLKIPPTLIDDLDEIMFMVISAVGDREPTRLKRLLEEDNQDELSRNNKCYSQLKSFYFF